MRKTLLIALMTGSLALGAVSTYAGQPLVGEKAKGELETKGYGNTDVFTEPVSTGEVVISKKDTKSPQISDERVISQTASQVKDGTYRDGSQGQDVVGDDWFQSNR